MMQSWQMRLNESRLLNWLQGRSSLIALALVVGIAAFVLVFTLTLALVTQFGSPETNLLMQASDAVAARAQTLYQQQRAAAQRLAFSGIVDAILATDQDLLNQRVSDARVSGDWDYVAVLNVSGVQLAGVPQDASGPVFDPVLSAEYQTLLQVVIEQAQVGAAAWLQSTGDLWLAVASPVRSEGRTVGAVLFAQRAESFAAALRASTIAHVTLYDLNGSILATTLRLAPEQRVQLQLDSVTLQAVFDLADQPVTRVLTFAQNQYRADYRPLYYGDLPLALVSTFVPQTIPAVSGSGLQLLALFVGVLAGMAGAGLMLILASLLRAVRPPAFELEFGTFESTMLPGVAVPGMPMVISSASPAPEAAGRDDHFRGLLRRERRERNYLLSILEALPEGVIVQDQDGHTILMNTRARELIVSQASSDDDAMQTLDELVKGVLGTSLAPGIYAIGDPKRLNYAGRVLQVQAAAVISLANQRLGTIILLRDISQNVQRDQAQEMLLRRLAEDIQEPLAGMAQREEWRSSDLTRNFVRELSRHANALQKMIVDMRDLAHYTRSDANRMQRPLALETLLWAVANDWRQIVHAANQMMHVVIEKQGLYVLGDEGRLRWALGNIIDNAIKYTPAGGAISLEIKDEMGQYALVRVRDNGAGIADEDKPHLFTPFYRGTPRTATGDLIQVPGMGQGLALTKQVIEAHGGSIQVKSRIGVGTAVYILLPLTAPVAMQWPQLLTDSTLMNGETVQIEIPPQEKLLRK